jgi:hypothetical protein
MNGNIYPIQIIALIPSDIAHRTTSPFILDINIHRKENLGSSHNSTYNIKGRTSITAD